MLVAISTLAAVSVLLVSPPQSRVSQTVHLVPTQSFCIAHLNEFRCTLVLTSVDGNLSPSMISSVRINDTTTQMSAQSLGAGSVSVNATMRITTFAGGLQDVNNVPPVTSGMIEVYLTDGTVVIATLPGEYQE